MSRLQFLIRPALALILVASAAGVVAAACGDNEEGEGTPKATATKAAGTATPKASPTKAAATGTPKASPTKAAASPTKAAASPTKAP